MGAVTIISATLSFIAFTTASSERNERFPDSFVDLPNSNLKVSSQTSMTLIFPALGR